MRPLCTDAPVPVGARLRAKGLAQRLFGRERPPTCVIRPVVGARLRASKGTKPLRVPPECRCACAPTAGCCGVVGGRLRPNAFRAQARSYNRIGLPRASAGNGAKRVARAPVMPLRVNAWGLAATYPSLMSGRKKTPEKSRGFSIGVSTVSINDD